MEEYSRHNFINSQSKIKIENPQMNHYIKKKTKRSSEKYNLISENSINKNNNNYHLKESLRFPFEKKALSFDEFTKKISNSLHYNEILGKKIFSENKPKINPFITNSAYSNTKNRLLLFSDITNVKNLNINKNTPRIISSAIKMSPLDSILNNSNKHTITDFSFNSPNKIINNRNNNEISVKNIIVTISSSKKNNINKNMEYIEINNNNLNNSDNDNDINIKYVSIDKKYKSFINQIILCLIGCSLIFVFIYFTSKENQKKEIKEALQCLSINSWIFFSLLIVFVTIIVFLLLKKKENLMYMKIAEESFEYLKKQLLENYRMNNEEFIGIFQNQFIRDCAIKNNLSEGKYIKYILPLLNEHINKMNNSKNDEIKFNIEESDILITGQNMKLWRIQNDND